MFNLKDWEFQWKIPVLYSEYEVSMVPFYEYTWLLQGANQFDEEITFLDTDSRQFGANSYNDVVHRYIMKDVPAFDDEEFITSVNDYIIKIDFQLSKISRPKEASKEILSTWEDMSEELLKDKNFGRYINSSERMGSRLLDTKILSLEDDKETFDHVLNYVKRNYNWNRKYGKYATKSVSKFIDDKFGNSADINLFTVGLLKAAGIEAKPVLISTRGNGKIKYDYPYAHFFNYVVILAKVNGVYELTDATEVMNLNNRIPIRGLNDKGLVVQENKVEWVSMETTFPSELKTDIQIEVGDDEIINSTISKTATEYFALSYRNNYSDKVETIKEKLESKEYIVVGSSISVENQFNKNEPYILTYE